MYNDITSEVNEHFPKLNMRQVWTLVKLCKHVRLRCRNNRAFNNFFNGLLREQGYEFSQVTKKKRDGTTYPGLLVTNNRTKESSDQIQNENEDE